VPWFRDRAHTVAAVAMFLAITLVAVYHACYARAAVRQRRARFYAAVAVAMLVTVIAAVLLLASRLPYAVLGVEVVLILLFGMFWGVQTWDVWNEEDRYPTESVPALAGPS
jgi:Ca2+/Na+ antiporter